MFNVCMHGMHAGTVSRTVIKGNPSWIPLMVVSGFVLRVLRQVSVSDPLLPHAVHCGSGAYAVRRYFGHRIMPADGVTKDEPKDTAKFSVLTFPQHPGEDALAHAAQLY